MGGCRCSYKNCQNTTKTTENVHFFHYPVKHKERCKIWIENADKPLFCDLEEDQLRNKVICEYHFEDRWFPNSQKKRLLQGAIPTIDTDVKERPPMLEAPETPLYLSSQLHDVQVFPANADRTIFVLDTDSIFSRSQKIESYIYKNGIIVPASKQTKPKPVISKPSTSTSNSAGVSSFRDVNSETISGMHDEEHNYIAEQSDYNVLIKKEIPDYQENVINRTIQQKFEHEVEDHYVLQPQEDHCESSNSQRKAVPRPSNMKNTPPKGVTDKSVGRNYLRQIKQHSRDIASIKRMLKQKVLAENKPSTNTLLNSLKDQLPSTFFTILNLNMNNKCDLTDEDVDFFTTIHKTSPEVYQLLIDKYKWNLPCVDIVESPME